MLEIRKIKTDAEIYSCFKVMSQLRPDIKEQVFVNLIRNQYPMGYQLVAVLSDDNVVAVAGFRILENLAWGKFLCVDELVTDKLQRSTGVGKKLLSWLHEEAENNHCDQLHLDSGVQRKDAHRFYEREGMTFSSHHYMSKL